jgi:hypothetical protein
MKRKYPSFLFAAFIAFTVTVRGQQIQTQSNQAAQPTGPGIYYKSPTGFVKLVQTTMVGGGAKHMGKMFVPGLTPQMVYTFRGAHSPIQPTEAKPVFYVKQDSYMANIPGHSERDIVIVRFDEKKDHRELQVTSGSSAFTMKAGFSKERTPDITTAHISDTDFTVVPTTDLKPGEYLITFGGSGANGYDFGIPKAK